MSQILDVSSLTLLVSLGDLLEIMCNGLMGRPDGDLDQTQMEPIGDCSLSHDWCYMWREYMDRCYKNLNTAA